MSQSFDVKDAKHQVGPSHPPDKASTWDIPVESDRWVHAHNAIRGEVGAMKRALAAVAERSEGQPLPDWAASSIKSWWEGHSRHVREHCAKEEEIMVPFVSARLNWPGKLKDEHGAVDGWQSEVGAIVDGLPEKGRIEDLRSAWEKYESHLLPHLREEEDTALPLTRAYFTQEEVSPLGRKMLETEPEMTIGAMIHFMGEDRFRSEFMKQQGIPFFVWHVAFKGRLATYKTEMVSHIDALVAGKPLVVKKKSGWGLF